MSISDWSSDVCSSDLRRVPKTHAKEGKGPNAADPNDDMIEKALNPRAKKLRVARGVGYAVRRVRGRFIVAKSIGFRRVHSAALMDSGDRAPAPGLNEPSHSEAGRDRKSVV